MDELDDAAGMGAERDFAPRTLRIDGQFRRSCLYLILGGWACTALAISLRLHFGQPLDAGMVVLSLVFCVAPIILWLLVATYRLRLDEWGLSRRRLGIWTRWPWEAFIQGDVSIDRYAFEYKARPLWDRWITTAFLPDAERDFVQEVVESIAPEECRREGRRLKLAPGEVTEAMLGLVVIKKLRVSDAGCKLLGSRERAIAWDDVTEFRLEAGKRGKHNIFQLTVTSRSGQFIRGTLNHVTLPGVSLVPHTAGHDEWVVHVQKLVPPRCWKYHRTEGALRSIEEGEYRRAYWKQQIQMTRWFQILGWGFLPLTAIVFVPKIVNAWNFPFLAWGWKLAFIGCAVLMIIQPTVVMCCLALSFRRRFVERLEANDREMAELGQQPGAEAAERQATFA